MKRTFSTSAILTLTLIGSFSPAYAQEQQPQQQIQGMTKPLGLTQDAWNARLRDRGESRINPGYVRYIYNPANVFPIRTRESMITTIKLPEDEELLQAFSGDDQGFQVGIPTPNSIAIKALFPGVDTNLVAYAKSGKIYTFYVRSEGYNSKTPSDFLVDVIHPGEGAMEGASITNESQINKPEKSFVETAQRIRDPYATLPLDRREKYREYSDWSDFNPSTVTEDLGVYVPQNSAGATIPYRVFRDDRFTYVDYGPNATQMTEWPTPLMVVQGVEGPVGFRTAGPGGRMLVMEALGTFVLRNGQRILFIKPKSEHVAQDPKNPLIEYAVAGNGPMSVPTDLPPGRMAALKSSPKTVLPTQGEKTANGEAPSVIAVPPQGVKVIRGDKPKERQVQVGRVTEIPAPTPASPIRTVELPVSAVAAAGVAMGASNELPVVLENIENTQIVSNTIKSEPLAPTRDFTSISTYKVIVGKGSPEEIEDKWKSYKVQYFSELNGKTMSPELQMDGSVSMNITPVYTIAEGMKLCSSLGSDGSSCTVKPVKAQR